MKLTKTQLKYMIKEEIKLMQEADYTRQMTDFLSSGNPNAIIQALELGSVLGLTPEQMPFDKLDISKEAIPNDANLLRIAEAVLQHYGDYITPFLRRKLVAAMEKGLRRRINMGMESGRKYAADKIRNIIKNELTAHERKINVIKTPSPFDKKE